MWTCLCPQTRGRDSSTSTAQWRRSGQMQWIETVTINTVGSMFHIDALEILVYKRISFLFIYFFFFNRFLNSSSNARLKVTAAQCALIKAGERLHLVANIKHWLKNIWYAAIPSRLAVCQGCSLDDFYLNIVLIGSNHNKCTSHQMPGLIVLQSHHKSLCFKNAYIYAKQWMVYFGFWLKKQKKNKTNKCKLFSWWLICYVVDKISERKIM